MLTFANFHLKLVTVAMSLEQSQNKCQIDYSKSQLTYLPENLVKIGHVHSWIIGLILKNTVITFLENLENVEM